MRRSRSPLSAFLVASPLLAAAGAIGLGLAGRGVQAQVPAPSPCIVTTQMGIAPDVVPLGYSARVSMSLRADCPVTATEPLHIVLVLDGSGSMAGEKNQVMRASARQFVRDLDLENNPLRQIGIVQISSRATALCQLTNDTGRVNACINKIGTAGGSAIDAGLQEGTRVLLRGRPRGGSAHEAMVLLVDGANNGGCGPVLQAVGQAKSMGVLSFTIALGADADHDCLRQAASSSRSYYEALRPQDLPAVFTTLAATMVRIDSGGWARATVRHFLPPNMRYMADSANPEPVASEPTFIRWEVQLWQGAPQATVSVWVEPLELGEHPVATLADGVLRDSHGQEKDFAFTIPNVRVVDGAGLPTPTPFPTRTPTNVPTPTSTLVPPLATPTLAPMTPRQCPGLDRTVPRPAIDDALANPHKVAGWGQLCNPSLPPGPLNGSRTTLSLTAPGKPYHPLFNGLEYTCGCP